jgi:hypothetical protein
MSLLPPECVTIATTIEATFSHALTGREEFVFTVPKSR